jgi:uncharacterized protein with beta-barrel porin domain
MNRVEGVGVPRERRGCRPVRIKLTRKHRLFLARGAHGNLYAARQRHGAGAARDVRLAKYAFGDVTPSAALAFQGTGAAFTVAGVPIARNSALVEAGFDWRFSPWAKLGLAYQGELAANAQAHAIKGAFTWDF